MKTTVSIPDEIYREAEHTAKQLGMSRSGLIIRALQEFLNRHSSAHITRGLNEVYDATKVDHHVEPASVQSLTELTRHDSW